MGECYRTLIQEGQFPSSSYELRLAWEDNYAHVLRRKYSANRLDAHLESCLKEQLAQKPPPTKKRRGPIPNLKRHEQIANVALLYGEEWRAHLQDICSKLDRQRIAVPKTWTDRKKDRVKTWREQYEQDPKDVDNAVSYRLRQHQKL